MHTEQKFRRSIPYFHKCKGSASAGSLTSWRKQQLIMNQPKKSSNTDTRSIPLQGYRDNQTSMAPSIRH